MGRAHEVRAASMAKTNLAKSKLYSKYGKLIYMEARNGADINGNLKLRALVDKAKKDQVPADVIKRNIEKAKGGSAESYDSCRYEAYGPSGSTFIIDCLTDNSNRTVSALKGYFGKCGCRLGTSGSVTFAYTYEADVVVKGMSEDEIYEAMLMAEIDIMDVVVNEDETVLVTCKPTDLTAVKDAITAAKEGVEIVSDEITWVPNDYVSLPQEDIDKVVRFMGLLGENDDVSNVYHNINNLPEDEE